MGSYYTSYMKWNSKKTFLVFIAVRNWTKDFQGRRPGFNVVTRIFKVVDRMLKGSGPGFKVVVRFFSVVHITHPIATTLKPGSLNWESGLPL